MTNYVFRIADINLEVLLRELKNGNIVSLMTEKGIRHPEDITLKIKALESIKDLHDFLL